MKILIVSDEQALKAGLAMPLAAAAHQLTDDLAQADLVLLDMAPDFNYEAMAAWKASNKPVILWGRSIEVEFAYQGSLVGVRGFISKLGLLEEQVRQLMRAAAGELVWPPSLVRAMLAPGTSRVHLTQRESELITLVARGLANKEIAYQMRLQEGTVKVYLSRLFDKVGCRTRHELGMYGVRTLGTPAPAGAPMPAARLTTMLKAA